MKKFFFFAVALFTAVSFAACSDDDDENVGGGGGETPTYYVSRIEVSNSYEDHYFLDFEYDEQNRLIMFKKSRPNNSQWVFNYVENKVICQGDYNAPRISYILNDKGYATQTIDGKYKFEYDNNGYLLQQKCDKDYSFVDYYTWENGDMIKKQTTYYDYGTETKKGTETFIYYDHINNQNIGMYLITEDDGLLEYYFLGRRSKHLLKSVKWEEDDGRVGYDTYEYEFDSKGRPVTIHVVWSVATEGSGRSTYKLSYK